MEKFKKYGVSTLKILLLSIIYLIILCILHYTGLLKLSTISKINFVLVAVSFLIAGIKLGKKASKKGFLEGMKLGFIALLILNILNLIFFRNFNLYTLMYYLLILSSSIIGSMIGINLHH